MIISDLQFMATVDTSNVKGGSGHGGYEGGYKGGKKDYGYYNKQRYALADGTGDAQAYGDYTAAFTRTDAIADSDFGFSAATSNSYADAFSSYYARRYH